MAVTSTYNEIPNNTHPNWWQDASLRKNAFWLAICAFASVYSGYDGSLLNGFQALPKFFDGATVAFLYLFYGFYDIAWAPLNLAYPIEILSFSLRAKGMSLWIFFGSVALCLNTWVNPIALKAIGYWYYIVYIVYIGVLTYLLVIAYFFFPETQGLSLEEVSELVDGHSFDITDEGAVNEISSELKAEEVKVENVERK
ncbi:hypothetical protein JCM24511_09533 [Saitozyma sp. JCM 24511]|nr:hypothetical protein JCM24511_09533 [Saitozyma sp. JCM 24511]